MATTKLCPPYRLFTWEGEPSQGEFVIDHRTILRASVLGLPSLDLLQQAKSYSLRDEFPPSVAIVTLEAADTAVLAEILGIAEIQPDVYQTAVAIFFDQNLSRLEGHRYEPLMNAYYQHVNSVKAETDSLDAAMFAALEFWQHNLPKPAGCSCSADWQRTGETEAQTVPIFDAESIPGLCIVRANGYAFPEGFALANTVILGLGADNTKCQVPISLDILVHTFSSLNIYCSLNCLGDIFSLV